ncbi:hypothetical protein BV898_13471 [Hypsibius exemplaris]|uniref:Uncharacterized protein n=1 Tax=Hypsibius exemplaris TaxID=2072580 RepID=A0A1W0WAT6_HYPEX|nr:hypothetical protein BV898_13471 [Hypsibius exemplaris]
MTAVTYTGKRQTLFVVAANVSIRSVTFETVILNLAQCNSSPSVFMFQHIRYFELFRGQLELFHPDEVTDLGDAIANALLIVWEVDRVMPQAHWNQLKSYISSFSKKTPVPILLVANLSEGVITSSPDYVRRLARDIQWFLTSSFDDTPSRHLWKCLLMRNNLFQLAYFKAHVYWMHGKISLRPEVRVPSNWQELKRALRSFSLKPSRELFAQAEHIPHFGLLNGEENRFLDTPVRQSQWYQGVDGNLFVKAFGNGQFATMSPWDFQLLMGELSRSITQAEQALGVQDWLCGELRGGYVKELVCRPKELVCSPNPQQGAEQESGAKELVCIPNELVCSPNHQPGAGQESYVKELVCRPNELVCSPNHQPGAGQEGNMIQSLVVTLTKPVRPWEAQILIQQAIPRIRAGFRESEFVKISMKSSQMV